jgi:hypothetical protein
MLVGRAYSSTTVSPQVQAAAKHKATAVTLSDLFKFGQNQSPQQRLTNAQFLHRELPIRIAQRVMELSHLPYGLSEKKDIVSVRGWFTDYFDLLSSYPRPTNREEEEVCNEYFMMSMRTWDMLLDFTECINNRLTPQCWTSRFSRTTMQLFRQWLWVLLIFGRS